MNRPTRKVAILTDPRTPRDKTRLSKIMKKVKGELSDLNVTWQDMTGLSLSAIVPEKDIDLFLVVGGDGTMIHFAGHLSQFNLPFFGLNYGNVGFMMNRARGVLPRTLEALKKGAFSIWNFPLLEIQGTDLDGNIHRGLGLNDVTIQRMTSQACRIDVKIGGEKLNYSPFLCDGIILSTPLGSTAYGYNVTRSIVSINTPVVLFTPIAASRTFPAQNIMLPLDTRFSFKIIEPVKRKVQMVCDSFSLGALNEAEVFLSKTEVQLCFQHDSDQSLPMRLINKME
ncbi:MAG: hypothetical protein CSA81_11220 [Acidobacteria bacterium]|nr:MAG: hypothetical protein CSA81_11220 [Acidobacteriota bacterium]